MNKQHRCIKLTSEIEQNNTFSFLDINITSQNNQLKTSIYRKPISMVFIHSMKITLINLTRSQRFSLCISLLFYLLGLHIIPLGCRKTKRNFKKEQLSIWYNRTINKNFFKQALYSKTSIFNSSKKGATKNFTLSWNHFIKFKAKTANFYLM